MVWKCYYSGNQLRNQVVVTPNLQTRAWCISRIVEGGIQKRDQKKTYKEQKVEMYCKDTKNNNKISKINIKGC